MGGAAASRRRAITYGVYDTEKTRHQQYQRNEEDHRRISVAASVRTRRFSAGEFALSSSAPTKEAGAGNRKRSSTEYPTFSSRPKGVAGSRCRGGFAIPDTDCQGAPPVRHRPPRRPRLKDVAADRWKAVTRARYWPSRKGWRETSKNVAPGDFVLHDCAYFRRGRPC